MLNSLSKKPETSEHWFGKNLDSLEQCGGSKAKMELHRDNYGRIVVTVKPERSIIRWLKNTFSRTSREMLRTLHNQALSYAVQPKPIALRIARSISAGVIPKVNARERKRFSAANVSQATQVAALSDAKNALTAQIQAFKENWQSLQKDDIRQFLHNYLLVSLLDPQQIPEGAHQLNARLFGHPVFEGRSQAYLECHNQSIEEGLNYFAELLTEQDAQTLIEAVRQNNASPARSSIVNYFSWVLKSLPVEHSELTARKKLQQKLAPEWELGILKYLKTELSQATTALKLQQDAPDILTFDIDYYENYLARKAELLRRINDESQAHNKSAYEMELQQIVEPEVQRLNKIVKKALRNLDDLNSRLKQRWQPQTLHDRSLTTKGFSRYYKKLELIKAAAGKA